MKKSKAIGLLQIQIEKINDPAVKRDEWLSSTSSVLIRIFPLSSKLKIEQLEDIRKDPQYFEDISLDERIAVRKKKAERFLLNYIEEIELLGPESTVSKMEVLFGSARFWLLLISICCLSFIAGNSTPAKVFKQSHLQQFQEMEREIIKQKQEIDSLTKELQKIGTLG